MKYFEENRYKGNGIVALHLDLSLSSSVVLNNLFFHEANDDADTKESRAKLAKSTYEVIAICEAIIDRFTEDERAEALNEIREAIKPINLVEMYGSLLKDIFK